jgi:hypothetical protein
MRWGRRAALAVSVALAAMAVLASSAAADPADRYLTLAWDGPITALDWQERGYAVAGGAFVGARVVAPGDRIQRTATVGNGGPSDAAATVEVRDVAAVLPPGAVNDDLQDCVHLFAEVNGFSYDQTWHQAIDAATDAVSWQISFPVAQGASFDVTVGAYLPRDATGGRSRGQPSQQLTFDVVVTLTGDTGSGTSTSPTFSVSPPTNVPAGGRVARSPAPSVVFALALATAASAIGLGGRRIRRTCRWSPASTA